MDPYVQQRYGELAQRDPQLSWPALEARVAADFKLSAAKLRREHDAKAAEIRAEAERRIAGLLAETEAAIADIRTRGEEAIESGSQKAERQVSDAQEIREAARAAAESRKADLAQGREALAGLRAQQQSIETDRHVRATAAQAEAKAREHEVRAAELTAALEALTRYKLQLAEQLPIKGLAVTFSEKGKKSLTLDGIPLATLNSGRLYKLATEVTLVRNDVPDDGSPRVRLVLLDGLEKLDRETQLGVLRECAERGTQVIACVVSEASLQVLSGEAALR